MKKYLPLVLIDFLAAAVIAFTVYLGNMGNWITENLSVVGYWYDHEGLLIGWGWLTGAVFVLYLIYIQYILKIRRVVPFLFTCLAGFFLIVGVYLPYQPEPHPVLSVIHIGCSFLAPVCVVAAMTSVLAYMETGNAGCKIFLFAFLIVLLAIAAVIFVKCTIITTLLEVYTVSAITLFMTVIAVFALRK